jgi:hypothetical protein
MVFLLVAVIQSGTKNPEKHFRYSAAAIALTKPISRFRAGKLRPLKSVQ